MRLIYRYLVREITPYVVMTLALLTSVIFLHEANRFSELFIVFTRNGLSTGPLFAVIFAVLPSILLYTLPISLLIGVLMGLGRLSGDSEIVALRASGVSRRALLWPLLSIGIAAAAVMTWITFSLAPAAQRTLDDLKEQRGDIIYQGLATQIKPRVFEESIPGKVFYIQELDRHTNEWKNIFIADTPSPDPAAPAGGDDSESDVTIYTARSGKLTKPKPGEILPEFHLAGAQAHTTANIDKRRLVEYNVQEADHLSILFGTDPNAPAQSGPTADPVPELPVLDEMDFGTLISYRPPPEQVGDYHAEINKRFSLPVTCLIFAIIGLAFGVYNQRSGRSFGLILGLILTTIYYVLTLGGEKSARSGAIPPWLGIWGPNLVFAAFGIWTTFRAGLPRWAQLGELVALFRRRRPASESGRAAASGDRATGARGGGGSWWLGFPRIVDRMIVSDLMRHVVFVIAGMTLIFLVFTAFELVGEIVQNRVGFGVVLGYLFYLSPQIISYMAPLAVLVAVMVTFGLMAGGSQVVALKASGTSIYRMAMPVFGLALAISFGVFALQNWVLPTTNRQQEDLRQQIRSGKEPPRTMYQVDRQWIAGKNNRIYYYRHYDAASDSFVELSVFDLDPETFQIKRRIWAKRATWQPDDGTWLMEFGWIRTFDGTSVTSSDSFREERVELAETPDYFKRPVSEADKLDYLGLRREIEELSSSGFDVLDLRIDLQGKLAFPLTCLVMALVGLPFAFSVGKRGALYGVAVGLAIGLVFWGALGLFTQMGRYEILPPILAAWGPNLLFGAGGAYMFLTTRT